MREILNAIGIQIISEAGSDFLCLCPFHSNRSTAAFAVSYSKGLYICYNPSCDAKGNIVELVKQVAELNDFQALRLILSLKKESEDNFDQDLEKMLNEDNAFKEFPQHVLDGLHENLMNNVNLSQNYFESRGINKESMEYFKLGYSIQQKMVIVPVHSPDGTPVGLVGRTIDGKRFKNSTDLPRSRTMFNLHRAKREQGPMIVVESTFDAIRVHQAGFPNVVATLGGHISKENYSNLNKYSSAIIIATDADEAGRKLGQQIVDTLKSKNVQWASYEDRVVYPHGAKDIGDMTDTEIAQCIKNAVSNFEYSLW